MDRPVTSTGRAYRAAIISLVIVGCVGTCLFLEWVTVPPPRDRQIHVEAFRYGTSPAVIRANRGDRLSLTFSSRDTGHSFMLQDYGIDAKISPDTDVVQVYDPYEPSLPAVDTRTVELTAGLPGTLGALAGASRFRCHVYCGPMHGFEQGDLIVRPNWLLAGSGGLLIAMVIVGTLLVRWAERRTVGGGMSLPVLEVPSANRDIDLTARHPWLLRLLRWRPLQFTLALPLLAVFMFAILAGLFGTKVGGRNLAVTLTWMCWMSLLVLLLVPLNVRLWCTVCPLPLLGEWLQRGTIAGVRSGPPRKKYLNRYLSLLWVWPAKLRGTWLRMLFFLLLASLSVSLAGVPRWTAFMLLLLLGLGTFMAPFWELRSFCRYLCPVASFLSTYGDVGRLMVRKTTRETCAQCRDIPCRRGGDSGWACPFRIHVGTLDSNAECGLCTECFKSCSYENVSLYWRRGPARVRLRSLGEAWQILMLLAIAMAYLLVVHAPWPVIRGSANIVDRGHAGHFALYMTAIWVWSLVIVPGLYWLLAGWGARRANLTLDRGAALRATAPAAIPLSLALFIAFFAATLMANYTFILMTFSDPFGWGWDLLGASGMPWIQLWPAAIPWLQVAATLVGLALSLRRGYALWLVHAGQPMRALRAFLPSAAMLVMLAGGMMVYFAHY